MQNFHNPDQRKNYFEDECSYPRKIPVHITQNTVSNSYPMIATNEAFVFYKYVSSDDFANQFLSKEEVPKEILMHRKNMLIGFIRFLDIHEMLPWQKNYKSFTLASRIDSNNCTGCQRNNQSFTLKPQINSSTKILSRRSAPPKDELHGPTEDQDEVRTRFVEDMKENRSDANYKLAAHALAKKVIYLQGIIQAYGIENGIEMPVDPKIDGLASVPSCQCKPTSHKTAEKLCSEVKTSNGSNMNLEQSSNLRPTYNNCITLVASRRKSLNQQEVNILPMKPTTAQNGGNILNNQNKIIQKNQQQLFTKPSPLPTSTKNNVADMCELQRSCMQLLKKHSRDETVLSPTQGNSRISKAPRRSQLQISIPPDAEPGNPRNLEIVNDFIQYFKLFANKGPTNNARANPPPQHTEKHNATLVTTRQVAQTPVPPLRVEQTPVSLPKVEQTPISPPKINEDVIGVCVAMLSNEHADHTSNNYFMYESDDEDFDDDDSDDSD